MNDVAKGLWVEGQAVPLKGLKVTGSIGVSISEITLEQTYRNDEPVAIEAVYSFPIPMHAVLLDVSIQIDERVLTGVVSAKSDAQESYERAIDDGDTAMIVRKVSNSEYSVSLGNLLPNETASIRYRFVMQNRWSGDAFRFSLPTVISDRYGQPMDSGYEIHECPWTDLSATHPFSLDIQIDSALTTFSIDSPTHALDLYQNETGRGVRLSSEVGFLDRDFVLNVLDSKNSGLLTVTSDRDPYSDNYTNQLTIQHDLSSLIGAGNPVSVKIVVDCSGSMGGDSIVQARQALHSIVKELGPEDEFTIVKFGSNNVSLSDEMLSTSPRNIAQAERFIMQIQADMGGTEIRSALNRAYLTTGSAQRKTHVLLITDGAVWGEDRVVEAAKRSDHCVFTVGVGSAVSEQMVRGLAEATGGECVMVTPNESMSDSILRQFRIMRQPNVVVELDWGVDGSALPGESNKMVSGESKSLFFLSTQPISKPIPVKIFREDQPNAVLELIAELNEDNCSADARARLCASHRISKVEDSEQQSLAVQYQLFTDKTAMTIVDEREVKSEGIPELRSVPQMPAAGHMGFGSSIVMSRSASARMNMSMSYDPLPGWSDRTSLSNDMEFLDIPAFLRSDAGSDLGVGNQTAVVDSRAVASWLNARIKMQEGRLSGDELPTLEELSPWIPITLYDYLRSLVGRFPESQIVGLFIATLFEQERTNLLNRHIYRVAREDARAIGNQTIQQGIKKLISSGSLT